MGVLHAITTCCCLRNATPGALLQVFVAAAVKMRVRPPKNAEELYEVDQGTSVVKGSRKMEHSNQLR